MKERLEKLIMDVTTLKYLIEYKVHDFKSDKEIEFNNPNSLWFAYEIEDFFNDLYFETSKYDVGQRKLFGRGLLKTIGKLLYYQDIIHLNGVDWVKEDFSNNFIIEYSNLQSEFSKRALEAMEQAKKFISEIENRIKVICEIENEVQPNGIIFFSSEKETKNIAKPTIEIDNGKPIPKKIKWDGSKIQLYNVIRQLKKKELISNSYLEIAGFICQNFEGFETNFSTVLKELQREIRLPKGKRIDLELSELSVIEENLPE